MDRKPIYLPLFVLLLLLMNHPAIYAQPDGSRIEKLYQEGKSLYYDGDYEKADVVLRKALDLRETKGGAPDELFMKIYLRLGKNERYRRRHDSTLDYLEKGFEICRELFGPESEEAADFLFEIGSTYSQMYRPRKANEYYEKCLTIYRTRYGENTIRVGYMYMNIGISYLKMADYDETNKYFQRTFRIFKEQAEPESQEMNRIYSNLGYLYRKMGDYDRAIEYGKKALEIKLLHYAPDHPSVPKYYRNIARAYEEKGDMEMALEYFETMIPLQEKATGSDHPTLGGAYGEMGNLLVDLGQYEKALDFLKKGLTILEKTQSPTHPYVVGGYFNIARVFEAQEDYDKALSWYFQALGKMNRADYVPSHLVAKIETQIGAIFARKSESEKALEWIEKGLNRLKSGQADLIRLSLLEEKGRILEQICRKESIAENYQRHLTVCRSTISLIETLRPGYDSEAAHELLNSRTITIYEQGVRSAFALHELSGESAYLEEAFLISEKSKANLLWQKLHADFALGSIELPPEVKADLEESEYQITLLEEALEATENDSLLSVLIDEKIHYQSLIESLETGYPKYYALKYASAKCDYGLLAKELSGTKKVILEYFYDGETIYLFLVRPEGLEGFRMEAENLEEKIGVLRVKGIADAADPAIYRETLFDLYDLLFASVEEKLAGVEELLIIPHGPLQFVSFDLLAPRKRTDDFRDLDYLIHRYTIFYAWSGDLYLSSLDHADSESHGFAGYAPEFKTLALNHPVRSGLSQLPFAQEEVRAARDLFSGNLFTGDQATESSFRNSAPGTKLLHLATHAFADEKSPYRSGLVFAVANDSLEDGFLNLFEIYNLKLDADMAVMSACNTGTGKVQPGEGVISLGRGFFYAGCKSVLMSLWLSNDQSNAKIMESFYRHLAAGSRKDVALRKAKLDYLNQADALTAHPHFWANMVVVGDVTPVRSKRSWWWLGVAVLVLLSVLVWRRA